MNHHIPSISIIIPTYNDAIFLRKCLFSILSQSVHPNEILVIDDGSDDKTASEICRNKAFQKLNIKFHRINNIGPAGARNFGLNQSNGEFILFLDADDYLPVNTIFSYTEQLKTLPENYFGISGQMKNFGKIFNSRSYFIPEDKINPELLGREAELQGQISCYILRATFLKNLCGFDEGLSHYEDFDLILRLLKLYKIKTIRDIVLFKRFHKFSQSNKNYRKSFWGTEKFLYLSREKSLFSENEVILRLRENHLSYGKQLFLKFKLFEAVENFNIAFSGYSPKTFKEIAAYILCIGFNFLFNLNHKTQQKALKSNYSISIVIPTYDDEEFLMETLGSVFAQRILPDEIILIDDGSDHDYASKFIDFFYHHNIKIIQKKIPNSGPSYARNYGASLSNSDFVIFLDSDDLLDKGAIAFLHKEIFDFDFALNWGVHGGISFLGSSKTFLPNQMLDLNSNTLNKIGKNKTLEGLSSFLFVRDCFEKVNGFRETLSHNEDFDIILRLSQKQSVKPMLEKIVDIRKRVGSLSNRSAKNSYEGVNIFLNIADKENLLDSNEILIRKKENTLTYGKSLFYEANISESLMMFAKGFSFSSPKGLKEYFAYLFSSIYLMIFLNKKT